jgi:hypothetical protein
VGGVATGDYVSCWNNLSIPSGYDDSTRYPIIPLADVSRFTDYEIVDIFELGGGVKEEFKTLYKKWRSFLDVGLGVDGKVVPVSIVFVKIDSTIITNLQNSYFETYEETIAYIRESVSKYVSAGTLPVIIDENNNEI